MSKIRVKDKRGYSYLRKDTGKKGRTPKSERWFKPGPVTGWDKDMASAERRRLVLEANSGDYLASGRMMQELVNVSTDKETDRKARADALYFFKKHRMEG